MWGLYKFDDVRVDPEERVITRGGKRLSLSGKAFDVLVVLLKNHGRLVRRDQLILEVWPDTHVGGGNLNVYITKIRKELGNGYIEAVPKQGYRFVADVIEGTHAPEEESTALSNATRSVGLIAAVILLALGGGIYLTRHLR